MFAIMGFMGDFTWAYTLILPRNITPQFVQSFTGFEIAYHNPDMGDVVGELANVLAGDVISTLNSRRIVARMGLPTVARGTDVEFLVTEGTPSCAVGFHCEFGSFGFRMMLARPTRSWHRRVGLPFNG
jgi:CheY-specific phosphatase CheX